ncbi:unnamed protein product [Caenorhabditis nigoni]
MITKEWVVNNRKEGFKAIGFVANKDIRKDAELTINYGYDYNPKTSQRCLCGTRENAKDGLACQMNVIGFLF